MDRNQADAAYEAARERLRVEPSVANREALKAAWDAREAVTPLRKGRGGFACRAGQRQAAERRALAARRNR